MEIAESAAVGYNATRLKDPVAKCDNDASNAIASSKPARALRRRLTEKSSVGSDPEFAEPGGVSQSAVRLEDSDARCDTGVPVVSARPVRKLKRRLTEKSSVGSDAELTEPGVVTAEAEPEHHRMSHRRATRASLKSSNHAS